MRKCNSCQVPHDEINPKTNKIYSRCQSCREKRSCNYYKDKANGKCMVCGGWSNHKARCLECNRKLKAKLRSEGKCMHCGGKKDTTGSLCTKCNLKHAAKNTFGQRCHWTILLELFHKQGGCCAITGVPLILGKNASIDHIIPRNRGGTNEIDNLRWVHLVVNRMKNDFLDNEFLVWASLIKQCLENQKNFHFPNLVV